MAWTCWVSPLRIGCSGECGKRHLAGERESALVARAMQEALRRERLEEALLPPVVALAIALVAGDLLILAYGEAPGAVWRLMIDGTWGNAYGFGQVLYKATTLTCTGLAVAMSLRAGLFNIGKLWEIKKT